MPRKKPKKARPFSELNSLWQAAGLPSLNEATWEELDVNIMPEGLKAFTNFLKAERITPKRAEDMYCFIMYDVENDKIRRLMAKYLEQKGCIRVQKSVFFARLHRKVQKEIIDMMRQMNACYENQDSIMILPVGEDMINNLACIGKEFELQLLTAPKHTLFF